GLKSGASPLPMSLFFEPIRPIGKRGQDLDEHMVAAKPECRRRLRYPRGGAFELMGEDGATWRDDGFHRLYEDFDAASVERGKPARFHEGALPIDDIGVECSQ